MAKLLFPSVLGDAPSNVAGMSLVTKRSSIVSLVRPPSALQQQIIDAPDDLVLVGGRGGGKEMPVSEPVLTPTGWRTMGDLQVGDLVIGSEGQSCKVTEIHRQGLKDVYAVRFKDGTEVKCGLDHLWQVRDLKNKYRVYSVRELLKMRITRLHSDSSTGLRFKFSVDAFGGQQMGTVNAPHAYALGYLLGNAHFQQGMLRVTCHSKYSDRLTDLLFASMGMPNTINCYAGNCSQITYSWAKIDPELAKYRESGLSGDKTLLPSDDYLLWNFDSRLALLRGLMDSDGTQGSCPSADNRQKLSFFSTSKSLIQTFLDLVRSIGGRCCNPRIDSREYISGYGAEVNFRSPVNPFKLRSNDWTQPRYSMRCAITEIENLGYQEESKCITIDSTDQLYVTSGWKLTHNSYGVALRIAARVNKYKKRYRGVYVRKTYDGMEDFEEVCREVFAEKAPGKYNIQKKTWRFDNGGFLKFNQLELEKHYDKFQGKSFIDLYIDEAGQFATPDLLDRLLSNIRGAEGLPLTRTIIANPGGVGHSWIFERYVQGRESGVPFFEEKSKRDILMLSSTLDDNPYQDNEAYRKGLISATTTDLELREAYLKGNWNFSRGAFFATVLSKDRSMIPALDRIPSGWKSLLGMDYGTAAPCSIYLAAISPGGSIDGQYFPANSIVLVDELYLAEENNISKGLNLDIASAATRIKDLCTHWKHDPRSIYNIADDACFMSDGRDSIADLFEEKGVSFSRARKGDRASSLEHFKMMLLNAGTEEPGIYTTDLCKYFWRTMPSLPRCTKNPSDLDTKSNDHIADCVRYISLSVRGSNEGLNMSKIGRC